MITSQSQAHRIKEHQPVVHVKVAHEHAAEGIYTAILSAYGGCVYDIEDNLLGRYDTASELFTALDLLSNRTERTIIKLVREAL